MTSHQHTLLPVICLVVLGLTFAPAQAAQLVYDNSTNDLEINLNATGIEVGDQITLGGTDRWLTEFTFEYWGDFDGIAEARVRFYLNDGDLYFEGIPDSALPNTVIFDSGAFLIEPTPRATLTFDSFQTGVDVPLISQLPDSFTWSVAFSGISDPDMTGLTVYGPPTVGTSYPDYWVNDGAGWTLHAHDDIPVNFAARFHAVPEPSTFALLTAGLGLFLLLRRSRCRA